MNGELTHALIPALEDAPDATALVTDEGALTWRELYAVVLDVHGRLGELGIAPGERVALHAESAPALVPALLALWMNQSLAVLLHPRLPVDAARARAESLGCARVVTGAARARGHHRPLGLDDLVPALRVDAAGVVPASPRVPAARWVDVVFTSGSTGAPKAAVHSFDNQVASAEGANAHLPFGHGDRWLVSLPLCHVGGLALIMRAALGGGALAFPRGGESVMEACARLEVTHLSLVTTQLADVLEGGVPAEVAARLKGVLVGGGPCPMSLFDRALATGLPVAQTYGCTEMTSQITTSAMGEPMTAGRALAHRVLEVDAHGEILVGGRPLFAGYLEGEVLERPVDERGLYRTGDLGTLDEGRALTVLGRKDNLFISGGENVRPEIIEAALVALPDVVAAVVVPVAHPRWGQRPVAFVKIREGAAVDADALRRALSSSLEAFMVPDAFLPWHDTGGLKPRREVLRELAEAALDHR